MLAGLCLEQECRRGHGGLYGALNRGEVRIARLRRALDSVPLRGWDDGRIRLGPADDATEVTAAQVRDVVTRMITAEGDPDIIVVLGSGYDLTRLAWLLDGLPVDVTGRLRSDRVMYFPAPPREPGANGRPPRRGPKLDLSEPLTWPDPAAATVTETSRYGTVTATAWPRLHQQPG